MDNVTHPYFKSKKRGAYSATVRPVVILISQDQKDALRNQSRVEGRHESAIATDALMRYLKRHAPKKVRPIPLKR